MPFTPGLEVCGVIDEVGGDVSPALVGSRIVGQPHLPHGGFADLALMAATDAAVVPAALDDVTAATLHLTYLTAWLGLHRRAAVRPGDIVVVTAAAGGVGSAAVQLAHAAGATVVGIASGENKLDAVAECGAEFVIDGSEDDVIDRVREIASGGADIVFDTVGGQSYECATKYIAFEGTIVVVGFASGTIPQPRLNHAFVKNYTIAGLHWSLYRQNRPELVQQAQNAIFEMAATGQITPSITACLGIEAVPAALEELSRGRTRGKTVIRV